MAFEVIPFTFTKPIRLLYTDGLMSPKPFTNEDGTKGAPTFNCQGLIPLDHPQLDEFKNLVMSTARKGLPAHVDEAGQWTHVGLKLCLKSGAQLIAKAAAKATALNRRAPERGFYAGQMVLSMSQYEKWPDGGVREPPKLIVLQNGKMVEYVGAERPLASQFFYNGVLASVAIKIKAFSGGDGGVTCYIDRVLSMNSGERINVGRSDEDVFGSVDQYTEYMGKVTAVDPTVGAATAEPW